MSGVTAGQGTERTSKSCGHTLRSASMQARPTCGTGRVACWRGAMSCSGERCCTIRQHRSGGGLPSPRGSRGLKCWSVSFGSCRLRDCAMPGNQVLLQAIPNVRDVQSVWLLLLHCAAARANSICALSGQTWWFSLPELTKPVRGSACAGSWGFR